MSVSHHDRALLKRIHTERFVYKDQLYQMRKWFDEFKAAGLVDIDALGQVRLTILGQKELIQLPINNRVANGNHD